MSDYAMYSDAGNWAVGDMVNRVLRLPLATSLDDLNRALVVEFNELAKRFPEVWDTDVREAVIGRIERETGRTLSIYF
jgi:hypothetical protein